VTAVDIVSIVVVLVLLASNAFFTIGETVLARLEIVRALRLDDEKRRGARSLVWLLEHPVRSRHVLLLLTVASQVVATGIATALALRHIRGSVAVAAATVAMVLLGFVVAEIAPRGYTLRNLERVGLRIAPLVRWLARAFQPVVGVLLGIARLIGLGPREAPVDPAAGEGADLVEDEEVDEELEEEERAMIRSIFELGDTVVREVMVPRPDMMVVSAGAALADVIDVVTTRGFSRIPVYAGDPDSIVGVVYAKDVLRHMHDRPGDDRWADLVRPATFVPESQRLDDLLRELQAKKVHLAVVVDEYGETVGLVTIEDVLEEIVGEIVDEYDREVPLVERLADGRIRVDARLPVGELNALIGADLPEDAWDTVGGLVFNLLGRVPRPGESAQVEGITLVAEKVQGRRVSKVLVHPASANGHSEGRP